MHKMSWSSGHGISFSQGFDWPVRLIASDWPAESPVDSLSAKRFCSRTPTGAKRHRKLKGAIKYLANVDPWWNALQQISLTDEFIESVYFRCQISWHASFRKLSAWQKHTNYIASSAFVLFATQQHLTSKCATLHLLVDPGTSVQLEVRLSGVAANGLALTGAAVLPRARAVPQKPRHHWIHHRSSHHTAQNPAASLAKTGEKKLKHFTFTSFTIYFGKIGEGSKVPPKCSSVLPPNFTN